MLTVFGKALRKIRIERGELLKDMAANLGVSSSYLSSVENGKKDPTSELMARIFSVYSFTEEEKQNLEEARALTIRELHIRLSEPEDEEIGLLFARKLNQLSDAQRSKIIQILNQKK